MTEPQPAYASRPRNESGLSLAALTGKRHRADYSRPPPTGLRTAYRLWLTDLVEHFGAVDVATWDRSILLELGDRIVQVTVNGRVYYAWSPHPGEEPWTLYAGATRQRSRKAVTYQARRSAAKCSCAEGGYVSYQLVGGRIVGRSIDIDELLDIAVEDAPMRPPRGWTYDDWRMRGFVPDPCPVRPTNAD